MDVSTERRGLWDAVRTLLGDDDLDSRTIRAGVMVAAALQVGPRIKPIRAYSGVPLGDVTRASYYLRRGGIWRPGNLVYAPWLEDDCSESLAVVTFVMHTMVATGDLLCDDDGELFKIRTVGEVLGVTSDIAWNKMIERRPLPNQMPAWLTRA